MAAETSWDPIETAPKDSLLIVNDMVSGQEWAAARWISSPSWAGWMYDDDAMADTFPEGPEPTHWLNNIPPLPNS